MNPRSGFHPLPAPLRLVVEPTDALSYDALVEEAQLAERQGRHSEARSLFEAALRRLAEAPDGVHASVVLRWIARTHQVEANLDLALDCLEAALAIAEAHHDEAAAGHATNLQAITHWQQGNLDEAEQLYLRARERALRAGEAELAAKTAQNLGVIANIRGDLDSALRYYETGLAACRALGLASDVCVGLNNLGLLHTHRAQWADAARSYEEAIRVADVLGDKSTRILVEVNLAECLVAQGSFVQAREACDRAMALSRETGDERAHGELQKAYGIIARETGDFALADECLARAQQIATRRQDLLLLAESAKEHAELHRRQGRNRDVLQCLNRAHRLFSQLRARRELADIDRRMGRLESDFLEVVRRWGESIESKDHYTQGHCERVADLACALAARTGMEGQALFWFRIGALLHDVGKLMIPPEVLNRAERLTPEEWALVRQHPTAGAQMLADVDFPWDVRPIVESHHERWDGHGYPHGLRGEEIPLVARILCIADVYDALTSERSYKKAMSHQDALDVMRLEVGAQFDPQLFALFEDVSAELAATAARPASPSARAEAGALAGGSGAQPDELTGLPLRRAFVEEARRALASRGDRAAVSLLVIDVDHFKLINDSYGHLEGDEVLRTVAQTLRRHVRAGAFLGRYAGDEFVLLLPGVSAAEAMEVAERLRAATSATPVLVRGGGVALTVTLSIGVAAAPEDGDGLEALFASADAALYDAKRQGRDAVARAGVVAGQRSPVLHLDRFTGRHAERRRLVSLLDSAVRGAPQVVAVAGEAGVGKTAVVRELGPEVRLRAGSLVVGRCVDGETRQPYAPWAALLNAIRVLRVVPERPWRELPRLVPALAADGPRDHRGNRFALFEEVAEFLRLAAVSRPIVLLLDDMQWADAPSWDLLAHLVARLERERLLICLTIRDEDAGTDVVGRCGRLSRDERFHQIRLARLTQEELRQWVSHALQQEAPPDLLAFLYRQTEGNAFFTVQVLRALVEEESLRWNGSGWEWRPVSELRLPTAVKDLVSRRLTRLSPKAQRILGAAAALGRTVDIDLAVAAHIAAESDLLDAIDEGLAASVLEVSTLRGDECVAFTHGLLVEVLHEHVHPRRLRRVHERIARALADRPGASPAEVATHFAAAGAQAETYRYALVAAERAATVYAYDEASTFLELARRHASPGEELADVHLRLAQIAELSGEYQTAEEHCARALGWYAPQGDRPRAAECRRTIVRLQGLRGLPPQATCDACRRLLAEAEAEGLEAERIALLTMISLAKSQLGDATSAAELARECVRLAEPCGDPRLLAASWVRLGTAIVQTAPIEAIDHYGTAAALFAAVDDAQGVVRCELNIGVASLLLGDLVLADATYERALERARGIHSPELAGLALINLGAVALRRGRLAPARLRLTEAHELLTRVDHEHYRLGALLNLAHLAREEREHDEALRHYGEVALRARALGTVEMELGALGGAGLVAAACGKHAVARGHAAEAARRLSGRADWWFQGRELYEALAVQLALEAGDAAGAWRHFRGALALADVHDAFGAAWLLAECAPALAATGREAELRAALLRYAPKVAALGPTLLTARYAPLMDTAGAPAAAARPPTPMGVTQIVLSA